MKKNTTLYIVMGAIALGVIYMLYKQGVFGGKPVGPTSPVLPKDGSVSKQIQAAFKAGYGEDLPEWLLAIADEIYTGGRSMDSSYLVVGQVTKSGAIMAAWASSYHGRGYGKRGADEAAITNQLYAIFNGWKAEEMRANLS